MSKTMNVSLTPELERIVQGYVERGLYGNQSEVIRAGLRLLHQQDQDREARLAALKADIDVGLQQVHNGESVEVSADEIKKRGRDRLSGEQSR